MHRLLLTLALICAGFALWAQEAVKKVDFEAWQATAARAEEAVLNGRASDEALGVLRTEIVDWRTQFQAAQSSNETRIATLKSQLTALGAAPGEGESEAAEISERRKALNEQLAALEAPKRTAEEAFSRSDGIIREIDGIIRERQSDALLRIGPTPLNPALWPDALFEIVDSVHSLGLGIQAAFESTIQRRVARDNAPLAILLVSIALVLMLRARRWIELLALRIEARETRASAGFTAFLVSIGQVIVPVLGVFSLALAISVTGLYGPRGEIFLGVIPDAGVVIFGAVWLAGRLFPSSPTVISPLNLTPERRKEGRFFILILALLFAADQLIESLSGFDKYPEETQAVLDFPVILIAGLILIRLGQILRQHQRPEDSASDETLFKDRLILLLGRAAIVVGFVGPVLAAIGYNTAAEALVGPTILSLALLGLLTLLQKAIRDGYAFVTRAHSGQESLVPVLLGFALALASAPVFALIWGMRPTELSELWGRFQSGISIGETTISPGNFTTLTVVFVIGYLLTRLVQGALRTSVLPKTRIDVGGQTAIVSGLGYVGIFLAALLAVTAAGINLSSLAIVAGALSVGIGFGLQNIVSNFVSGIILLIERPISEGDMIDVGGQMGVVRDISVRSTRIETFDRTDVIVPNADLVSGVVTNWTRGNLVGRVIVPVGVGYTSDTKQVETILTEIASAHPMVLLNPPPAVILTSFGADSLNFEIRAILRDVNWKLSVHSDMNHEIVRRFREEGIEIPFAQRDLWLRNPEALTPEVPPKDQDA